MNRVGIDLLLLQLSSGGEAAVGASLAGSEHLGISYLAASAAAFGLEAEIIDLEEDRRPLQTIVSVVVSLNPTVVGMSPTSKTAPQAAALSEKLRQHLPDCLIVWGGHLATGLGSRVFVACNSVDCVVVREGEAVIPDLVEFGRRKALPMLPAVLANHSSRFARVACPTPKAVDWRTLLPVRHKSSEHYNRYGARILTSMGCKFDCSFCTTPSLFGRSPRQRMPSHVADEVLALAEQFGTRRFWINDDLFCDGSEASQRRAITIARNMRDAVPDVRFRAMLRSDLVARKPEFLKELKANGLEAVFVGLESGNAIDMALFRKRLTVDQNVKTASTLSELGIFLQIGFIMFSNATTIASIVHNAEFLQHIRQLYRFMPLSRTVQIFPGTALWESSISTDDSRSNAYVKVPKFSNRAVETLSYSFERLEEDFAPSDRAVYWRALSGQLSNAESNERGKRLVAFVRRSCSMAEKHSTVEDIVSFGRATMGQLDNV
jgi:radical SAM superfamily enzyme YgiQ (UPF0313 family)